MGYHRIATFHGQETIGEPSYKQFLFWAVYILDKSLALRLGRASTIQDYDITISEPAQDGANASPVTCFFDLWVMIAKVQGQIYELLYCPTAIAQSDLVRKTRVQLLLGQLDELDRLTNEATVR
jgi:hypothetical protein